MTVFGICKNKTKKRVYTQDEVDELFYSKNDIKVVTGTIVTPAKGDSSTTGQTSINYPEGFNYDNCVIVSVMAKVNENFGWATTMENDTSASSFYGAYALVGILKQAAISIRVDKIMTDQDSQTIAVRAVLMKIK